MKKLALLIVLSSSLAGGSALADDPKGNGFSLKIGYTAGTKWIVASPPSCDIVPEKDASDKSDDRLIINVMTVKDGKVDPKTAAPAHPAFMVTVAATPAVTIAADKADPIYGKLSEGTKITLNDAVGTAICTGAFPKGVSTPPANPPPPDSTVIDSKTIRDAQAFLVNGKTTANEVTDGVLERHVTIHYLPNGAPAFPIPGHVTESDLVNLDIVLPDGFAARLKIASCASTQAFRIFGNNVGAAKDTLVKQGNEENKKPDELPKGMARLGFAPTLQCSDSLSYTITVTDTATNKDVATADTTVQIDPVYTFSVGVAGGYDGAAPDSYSLRDLPDTAASTGSSKFVTHTKNEIGLRSMLTVTYHPFRFNPRQWSYTDLLSPFVGFDPTHPWNGAVAGNEFVLPSGLFGILAGVSIYQSDQLPAELVVPADKKWVAAGDLPKNSPFGHSFGGFIGLNLNAVAVAQLFSSK